MKSLLLSLTLFFMPALALTAPKTAPQKLDLSAELELEKSSFALEFDLAKARETRRLVVYKGTVQIVQDETVAVRKVKVTMNKNRQELITEVLISGNFNMGQTLFITAPLKDFNYQTGETLKVNVVHSRYITMVAGGHTETFRTTLDRGVGELVVR